MLKRQVFLIIESCFLTVSFKPPHMAKKKDSLLNPTNVDSRAREFFPPSFDFYTFRGRGRICMRELPFPSEREALIL